MAEQAQAEAMPEILPLVIHLKDLLKWVRTGSVRVPRFQRDFVWDRERMRDLFDSIRKQYPIGTLLFWCPTKPPGTQPRIGPLRLPDVVPERLLLDGQQRLTTLAGVLLLDELGLPDDLGPDPQRWDLYFDAAQEPDGAFIHLSNDGHRPPSAVAVRRLLGTRNVLEATRELETNALRDIRSDDAAALVIAQARRITWGNRIESVANALNEYRIPVVQFKTDNLRLAVESFTRLNRRGMDCGPDEMYSALTYQADEAGKEHFRLATHIDEILRQVEATGFGRVDRVLVLRTILVLAGLDPFRGEWDRLGEKLKTDARLKLPGAIAEATAGLLAAVAFLAAEGVHNTRLLPYSAQLVGLGIFFARCPTPTDAQRALLRRWLWVTAFTCWFGGGNPARVRGQFEDLRDRVSVEAAPTSVREIDLYQPAEPFPDRYDMRSARVRALLCAMLRDGALDRDSKTLSAPELSATILTRGPEAMSVICTGGGAGARKLRSSAANRIFDIAPIVSGQATPWVLRLGFSDPKILASHFIDRDMLDALRTGDRKRFLDLRQTRLMEVERAFMAEKGVVPPVSKVPGPTPLDVDDEAPLSDPLDE